MKRRDFLRATGAGAASLALQNALACSAGTEKETEHHLYHGG